MSHEPHARTDATAPGSTPADEDARPNVELARQRAEEDDDQAAVEVPPSESVPDDVAAEATRELDPRPGPPPARDRDLNQDDPMRPSPSSSDVHGMPGGGD